MPDDDTRIAWLTQRVERLETKMEGLEAPMRSALSEIQRWQTGAIEREQRREDAMKFMTLQLTEFRVAIDDRLRKIEESIPNKAVNDLVIKAVIGLGGTIIAAVIALWLGALGIRK